MLCNSCKKEAPRDLSKIGSLYKGTCPVCPEGFHMFLNSDGEHECLNCHTLVHTDSKAAVLLNKIGNATREKLPTQEIIIEDKGVLILSTQEPLDQEYTLRGRLLPLRLEA